VRDFWSIDDDAANIRASDWQNTIEAVRQCKQRTGGPGGCVATFVDPEFPMLRRDAVDYARAFEAPSQNGRWEAAVLRGGEQRRGYGGRAVQRRWRVSRRLRAARTVVADLRR